MMHFFLFLPTRKVPTIWLGFLLLGWLTGGCAPENPAMDPEWVAQQFMDAVGRGDYAMAKQWATQETQATLEFQEKLGSLGYNPFRRQAKTTRHEVAGQHAKVWFQVPGQAGEDVLQLRKTGRGEWRVRISKADPSSEQGVNFVYDWLEDAVPAEKRWAAMDSLPSSEEPAATAHRFLLALEREDLATARGLATTETRLLLDAQQAVGKWSNPFVGEPFKLTGAEVWGDSARIIFRQRANNRPRQLVLVQAEGKWWVDISLENMQALLLENSALEWMAPLQEWYREVDGWKEKLKL